MTETVIRILDDGRHQVGLTDNGINVRPVGTPFANPRSALAYAKGLDDQASRSRLDDSAASGEATSGDDRAESEAPDKALDLDARRSESAGVQTQLFDQ